MRRLFVVVAISAALFAFAAFACGGPDKPPLTPDTEVPNPDALEGGAAPTPSSTPAK